MKREVKERGKPDTYKKFTEYYYDRSQGDLSKKELSERLGVSRTTLDIWFKKVGHKTENQEKASELFNFMVYGNHGVNTDMVQNICEMIDIKILGEIPCSRFKKTKDEGERKFLLAEYIVEQLENQLIKKQQP